jgi:hypothetical protein
VVDTRDESEYDDDFMIKEDIGKVEQRGSEADEEDAVEEYFLR